MNERLLKYLVEQGLITEEQADRFRTQSRESGQSIRHLLVESGAVEEEDMLQALSCVSRLPIVRLYEEQIGLEVRQILRADQLREHLMLPFGYDPQDSGVIRVAMCDPMNIRGRDLVSIASKCRIKVFLATPTDIRNTIDRYYGSEEIKAAEELYIRDSVDSSVEEEQLQQDINTGPVVQIVNKVIEQAVRQRASDIHIEPQDSEVRVRYRVDGVLFVAATYDRRLVSAITTRVKIISGLDISEKRKPQDGRATIYVDGREYDIRVSTLPAGYGEKCVMRISLKKGVADRYSMKFLGFHDDEMEKFQRILDKPNGIVLVTGPTGSGKSRTLYTALNQKNNVEVNIVTVEDPVEISIDGVNQVQVNPKAGLTFASALRSILRQDPDIIMIGEIRDSETADIAVRASITGHLVLSTLHTNDTVSSISRMTDMGVESYLLADSLVGIVAKRLMRCLCHHCKKPHALTEAEIGYLKLTAEEAKTITIYEADPKGCQKCNGSGYFERIGVYEILEITPRIRNMIARKANTDEILAAAIEEGMSTLHQSARRIVLEGHSPIQEMKKISAEEILLD